MQVYKAALCKGVLKYRYTKGVLTCSFTKGVLTCRFTKQRMWRLVKIQVYKRCVDMQFY